MSEVKNILGDAVKILNKKYGEIYLNSDCSLICKNDQSIIFTLYLSEELNILIITFYENIINEVIEVFKAIGSKYCRIDKVTFEDKQNIILSNYMKFNANSFF